MTAVHGRAHLMMTGSADAADAATTTRAPIPRPGMNLRMLPPGTPGRRCRDLDLQEAGAYRKSAPGWGRLWDDFLLSSTTRWRSWPDRRAAQMDPAGASRRWMTLCSRLWTARIYRTVRLRARIRIECVMA